jgi:polyhydroxyalkanoate synthesis repressor PhaR
MNETIHITRYPNRRLYDRSQKKYVKLGDIEELILAGKNVQVQDSKSKEDLTRVILTQIILERHPERMDLMPVSFLHAMLRTDKLALDWLRAYFATAQAMMSSEQFPNPTSTTTPFESSMDMWRKFMPGFGGEKPEEENECSVS